MITRQYTSFQFVHSRFTWISRMFVIFFSENLGEFRIRGLQIGLYLRNISNENLGVNRLFFCTRFKAVQVERKQS